MRFRWPLLLHLLWGMLSAVAPAAETFAWGVNGHPCSQEVYFDVSLAAQLDLVADLGAGWYRVDLTAGFFAGDTARFDELVNEAARRKIHLLPVLSASPSARDGNASPAQIRAAAATFAKAVVSRYKGRITHWELENELDAYAMIRKGEKFRNGALWNWDGAPDGSAPENYQETRYQKARAAIQGLAEGADAADPAARTIVNTAGWLHHGFIQRLVNEDQVPFHILAWHWYSEMGDMTRVQDKLNLVGLLKGYGKPLWITEINRRDGTLDGNDTAEAAYVRGPIAQLAAHPSIEGLFIYELLDEPNFGGDEGRYGLVEVQKNADGKWQVGRKKPSFAAFQEIIKNSTGRR